MRKNIYKYRATTEPYDTIEREFEVFEEPETLEIDSTTYEKVPNQATGGWVLVEYHEENGDGLLIEYWKTGEAPESLVHNGKTYLRQFGAPSPVDPYRMGSGLIDKCDKGFQEVMKAAKNRAGRI